jgi:acetylglutamate kinase
MVAIKCGGSLLNSRETVALIIKQIAALLKAKLDVVLIHGGGKHITSALDKSGIETKKIEGLRVTDKKTLDIVIDVLFAVNKALIEDFASQGLTAVGFCQPDKSILQANKLKLKDEKSDLGFVGEVESVNTSSLKELFKKGNVPVIAPIGKDEGGNFYNINADHAACAIATALKADRLIFLTDVAGVLTNIEDPTSRIGKIQSSSILHYIANGSINGGMLPKLQSCQTAIANGVKNIVILNGDQKDSILNALLNPDQFGTLIEGNPA